MLQSFRKYTQGWVATLLVSVLSLAFVFWGVENYLQGSSKDHAVARVNGKNITQAELEADYQRIIAQVKGQQGGDQILSAATQQQLKAITLQNLITQRVLVQAATHSGFRIVPQETSAVIKQMPAFQEGGNFSHARFERMIANLNYSPQEFVKNVQQSLLLNQVVLGLEGSAFVLPRELTELSALLHQKRDFSYILFSKQGFKKNISLAQLEQYYKTHSAEFKSPAKIQIEYLVLAAEDVQHKMSVTSQDLSDYFNANTGLSKEDPKVVEKVRAIIQQQKAEQAFLTESDKLSEMTYADPGSLQNTAKELGLTIETSDYFAQSGGSTPITKNPKVIAAAFSPESIKSRNNSPLIEFSSGKMIVLRVKGNQPEGMLPFSEVKEQITARLEDMGARNAAKHQGEVLLADLEKGKGLGNVSIISKQAVGRDDKNVDATLRGLAFSISPKAGKPFAAGSLANGDYVVVLLKKVHPVENSKMTSNQREQLKGALSKTYGKTEYQLYTASQMGHARIKIH